MVISFDSIQPMTSVMVMTSLNNPQLVRIEFAQKLDQDVNVKQYMQSLWYQPFVNFDVPVNQQKFDIIVNSNYSLEAVVDSIVQTFESHGMKVGRLSGLIARYELKSFTAQ